MSTMHMTAVSGSSQMLIDARLDAIDRALLGRLSRQERLNVVGEVEGRIHEMLNDRCGPGVEPARDDVLAVLGRLDPPEAYLSEGFETDDEPRAASHPARSRTASALPPARFALYGGVLGLTALAMIPLTLIAYFVFSQLGNEILLILTVFGGGVFMVIAGVAGIALSAFSRMTSGWAVVGVVAGALSFLIGMGGLGIFLVVLL